MSIPTFSLQGKVSLVTGSRRGIGKTIALAFAEAGADVAVCDVVLEGGELEAVADEIRKLGRRSLAVQADTSRKPDVEDMVKKVVEQFGAIDILVNDAAIVVREPILDMLEEDWDRQTDINLKGYFLCAQAVGKIMKDRKSGNIINIASDLAFKPDSGVGAYCVVKASAVMLTRVLAKELGDYGIRANAIAPGLTRTEMGRPLWENTALLKQMEATIPLGRIGETNDLVGAALFLASEASSYITGHTLLVNGGYI
jgi:NAD(P)-dependent dehydrogenase (short-subunit alcohol dehydrogenase family)